MLHHFVLQKKTSQVSVVSQVMLKATFRILLARDKPERALQAAEEAFPVLHGHFVEGHKSA